MQKSTKALIPLFLVIVIDIMGIGLIFPVLTPLFLNPASSILPHHTTLLTRDLLYGLALTVFPLGMFFGAPLLGDLSDKFGRKKILLLCLLGSAFSYGLAALGILFDSLVLVLVSRTVAGLLAGSQPIAQAAIIDVSPEETKTKNIGKIVLAMSVGFVIGPMIGGFTADHELLAWFNFATPFELAAVLSALNALMLFLGFQETHEARPGHRIEVLKGFKLCMLAFTEKRLQRLSLILFSFEFAWALYFQAVSWLLLQQYHYNTNKIGLFMAGIGLASGYALTDLINRFAKWFANDRIRFKVTSIFLLIAMVGCSISLSEPLQWIWMVFGAFGAGLGYSYLIALFSAAYDKDKQGLVMGISGSVLSLSWFVTAMIAGPLGFWMLRAPFILAAISAALCWLLARRDA